MYAALLLPLSAYRPAGASAKIAATIVTYPMIVIKSRLQAAGSHTAAELQ
jgi:hypothetical protein